MRPEQITQLSSIEEELTDVFIAECQPKTWPAMVKQKDRGDRYWFKKNALATLSLVGRLQTVLREIKAGDPGNEKEAGAPRPAANAERSREDEARALVEQGVAILERHRKRRGAKG